MDMNKIYTLQSYIDDKIVTKKQAKKDYKINVAMIDDDGEMVAILVDGNHSLEAAKRDGVMPDIKIVKNDGEQNLVRYVTAFNDLSNPVNIVTGATLW